MKWIVIIAGFLGLFSVLMGAASDHMLEGNLSAQATEQIDVALRYHQIYSIVLLALGLYGLQENCPKIIQIACLSFLTGIIIFSGSLYLSAFFALSALTFGTPVGGILLMVGWGLVAVFGFRIKTRRV